MSDNAETLEQLHREVLRGNFRGQIVLHCDRGRIEDVEVLTRWAPPWKRNGHSKLDTQGRRT